MTENANMTSEIRYSRKEFGFNNTPLFVGSGGVLMLAVFCWYQWQIWINLLVIVVLVCLTGSAVVIIIVGTVAVGAYILSWGVAHAIPVVKELNILVYRPGLPIGSAVKLPPPAVKTLVGR